LAFDPTRLVIKAPQGGRGLYRSLEARGIDLELSDEGHAVCVLTAMDGEKTLLRLGRALERISPAPVKNFSNPPFPWPVPRQVLSPRQAALAQLEPVHLGQAAGRISGASAGLYPPGIPLVVPGEEVLPEAVAALEAAPEDGRFGLAGGCLLCVAKR
jgi:arginine decarboxylase